MIGAKTGPLRRAIYKVVEQKKYVALKHLHQELRQYNKHNISMTVYQMCHAKDELFVAGTAKQAAAFDLPDFDGIAGGSFVYAICGTRRLPGDPVQPRGYAKVVGARSKATRKPSSGSGVIAPPPYRSGYRWSLL